MRESVVEFGELASMTVLVGWVAVFGGDSRPGNRRARRLIAEIGEQGLLAVWFDGFEEISEENGVRVPVDGCEDPDADVLILPFRGREDKRLLSRLEASMPRSIARWVRRLNFALSSLFSWRTLRPELRLLEAWDPPTAIVYCDDSSLATAWHAARLWPDTEVAMELPSL